MSTQGGQQPQDINENNYQGTQMSTSTAGLNEGHKPAADDVIVVGEPSKSSNLMAAGVLIVGVLILVIIAGIFINHANSRRIVLTQFVTQSGECYRIEGTVPDDSVMSTSEFIEFMAQRGIEPRPVGCYKSQA